MIKRTLAVLSLSLLAGAAGLHAQAGSLQQQRVRKFATLPDWTGIWEAEAWTQRTAAGRPAGGINEVRSKSGLMGHPPYKAEWEARYQAGMKDKAALAAAENARKVCAFGFPMNMESPSLFQVVNLPEETLFVFVTQDVRHVYTDGRPHAPPDEIWPTRMGDSIGHWEGATLVIDTVARLATAPIGIASPMSKVTERAHFTERLRLVSPTQLENVLTIDDPAVFAHPWTVKIRYRKVTELPRMGNYDCDQNDRNPVVDGKLTVKPP